MKRLILLFAVLMLLTACKHDRKVSTSFYYWKTIYQPDSVSLAYQQQLHAKQLYVRIMDVDMSDGLEPVPVSPIIFRQKLPDTVGLVPVVYIVNNVLKTLNLKQINELALHIVEYTIAKASEAGKPDFNELQIDCDWTATTRQNYFYLLKKIAAASYLKHKTLSATLRLHQLKNLRRNGIPPVNKVMLMCYNMGNLRKYGNQNSIIELSELKRYAGSNVSSYPLPIDVGLPLFNWAVVFRNKDYIGISKKLTRRQLLNKNEFIFIGENLYRAKTDLPQWGIVKNDEVRWEDAPLKVLQQTAGYLAPLLKQDSVRVIYYHLDHDVVKPYTYAQLTQTAKMFR